MTINTTKDVRPETKADPAGEPPIVSKAAPSVAASPPPFEPELEVRVMARRAELVARLKELGADVRQEATEAAGKLKAKLSELAHIVKLGVVDGWANVHGGVTSKLEQWLAEASGLLVVTAPLARAGQA